VQFFDILERVPWWRVAIYLFVGTFVIGNISTALRRKLGWQDGYSRKLNHIGLMLLSGPLLAVLPDSQLLPAVVVATTAMVLIYAVAAYSERPLVYGIVSGSLRQRDAPRSRLFFFMPLITCNVALAIAAFSFPLVLVKIAFFTVAVADGLAEPVGLRFGQGNGYQIKDPLWGTLNRKSLAGSTAVLLLGFAVALGMLALTRGFSMPVLCISVIYAIVATFIEAISPRGLDNMLIVLIGPLVLSGLIAVIA
jgi:dolichol kinase